MERCRTHIGADGTARAALVAASPARALSAPSPARLAGRHRLPASLAARDSARRC
jgi:hypothetical protein